MAETITKRAAAAEVVRVLNFGKYFGIVMIVAFFLVIGLHSNYIAAYGAGGIGMAIAMAYTVMAHKRIAQLNLRWSLTAPTPNQPVVEEQKQETQEEEKTPKVMPTKDE